MWRGTAQFALALLIVSAAPPTAAADLASLEAGVNRIIRTSPGEVGVALVHIESGARLSIHGDRRFPMASVYKLPIAIEALAQVAEGTLVMARPVTLGPNDIRA